MSQFLLQLRTVPPRWAKSYLSLLATLAESGVRIDEDAAIRRITRETRVVVVGPDGTHEDVTPKS